MNATQAWCRRIASTGPDDLTDEAIRRARQLFLDGIAVAVAGTVQEAPPAILAAHARELGGTPSSTVIGFGFKTNPTLAAYVNGSSMHVLDFEPMWSPANHQLSTCMPAVLALAEQRGLGGREAAAALVKGIETMGWLREASQQFDSRELHFHPPGLVGPMGAAVAAGHMLGLDAEQLQHAVGIAGSRCGSLLANAGTMTKSTHCGLACMEGLDAALLAARGFTANPDILECARGYVDLFFDRKTFRFDLLERFGPPFRVVDPGYSIKMFPSQFGTHFVITAGLALHPQVGDPARIRQVRLTTPVMAYVDRPKPATGLAGKFSFQYVAACSLLDGRVTMDTFTDAKRFSAPVEDLLQKITVTMRDDIPGRFEKMHVEMEVELDDGRTLRTRCDGPRGKWGTPPIPPEEHLVKVRDCLSTRLEPDEMDRVIALAGRFETLSPAELAEVMAILGGSERAPS